MSGGDEALARVTEACAKLKAGEVLPPALARAVAEQLVRDHFIEQAGHDLDALYDASVKQGAERALIAMRVTRLAAAAELAPGALEGLATALCAPDIRKHAIIKLATDALRKFVRSEEAALHLVAAWLDTTRDNIKPLYDYQPKRKPKSLGKLDPDGVLLGPLGVLVVGGGKKIF